MEDIFSKLLNCVSSTWFGCILEKSLLATNIMSLLTLTYLIFIVYIYRRQKPWSDFRVILMLIGLVNAIFVAVNELFFSFQFRLKFFFLYDLLRFAILYSLCYFYSSIVTKNLLPYRKNFIIFLRVFFWVCICFMSFFGASLSIKLENI